MTSLLQYFIILPILGFVLSLLVSEKKEDMISWTAFLTVGIHMAGALVFLGIWLFGGHPVVNYKDIVLFQTVGYEFYIDFYFDGITATYLFVGSFLTFLVTIYSRYYMHREGGYKRFFNTILFFYIGYNVAIFSG